MEELSGGYYNDDFTPTRYDIYSSEIEDIYKVEIKVSATEFVHARIRVRRGKPHIQQFKPKLSKS